MLGVVFPRGVKGVASGFDVFFTGLTPEVLCSDVFWTVVKSGALPCDAFTVVEDFVLFFLIPGVMSAPRSMSSKSSTLSNY